MKVHVEDDRGREREVGEADPAVGVECPSCGCRHLPVAYTRQIKGGRRRIRHCRNCGKRVITTEKIQGA